MIDLHAHLLPGVDDGPRDMAAAVALARRHVELGVETLVLTSHVSDDYPNTAAALRSGRSALAGALAEEGIPLRLQSGAEIAIDRALFLSDDELRALRLGHGDHLLVESPLSPSVPVPADEIAALRARGFGIVLAHPERAPCFQRDQRALVELVADGVLTSITAGALVGRFGRTARRTALELLAGGLVHNLSSDAHDVTGRPPGALEEIAEADAELHGLVVLAPWLTRGVPAALLAGEPLPPRPRVSLVHEPRRERPRRGLARLLRR